MQPLKQRHLCSNRCNKLGKVQEHSEHSLWLTVKPHEGVENAQSGYMALASMSFRRKQVVGHFVRSPTTSGFIWSFCGAARALASPARAQLIVDMAYHVDKHMDRHVRTVGSTGRLSASAPRT